MFFNFKRIFCSYQFQVFKFVSLYIFLKNLFYNTHTILKMDIREFQRDFKQKYHGYSHKQTPVYKQKDGYSMDIGMDTVWIQPVSKMDIGNCNR